MTPKELEAIKEECSWESDTAREGWLSDNCLALVAAVERLQAERDAAVDYLHRITSRRPWRPRRRALWAAPDPQRADQEGPTGDGWEAVDAAAAWLDALVDGQET